MLKKFFFYESKIFYLILLSFFLHVLAAYFSEGFYQQDEHFSILEPINFKLGKDSTLGWDFFFNYDRQWFLSFFYFFVVKILSFFQILSPFKWAFVIRFISSIIGWISIICLIHIANKILKDKKIFFYFVLLTTFFWFYPYFHARPASENIGSSFLVIGISFFLYFIDQRNKNNIFFICGILLGLSFLARYTNIVLICSFCLWILFFYKYYVFYIFDYEF